MKIQYNIYPYFTVCVCLIFFFFPSCRQETALERALRLAGDNRQELERVLLHYKDDSLKQEAARFLIENMPYHSYQEEFYRLSGGEKYRPKISDFHTDNDCRKHLDSLASTGYMAECRKFKDIQTLGYAFLVRNIDLAFKVWQKPWAQQVPFAIFCRYILPYRTSREYPSELREEMMEKFTSLLDSAGVVSPLEACSVMNEKLRAVVKYKKSSLPFYPTIEETYASGSSQCEGMCDLGLFIMRAAGIPVAMEQTVWTRMDLGHSWGAVWHDGRFHAFAPGGRAPGTYQQVLNSRGNLRPAKVYRSHFSPCLTHDKIGVDDDGCAIWLKSPLLEDVTAEYLNSTIDIHIVTDCIKKFSKTSGQVYLCAYNYYKWTPVVMGNRTDSVCRFRQVGGDNIFIVADSPGMGQFRFLTPPFHVDVLGNVRKFVPCQERTSTFTLSKIKGLFDRTYTLRYWDTETASFSPLEYSHATDSTQTYANIPENALLWFTVPDRIVNQRVFFIENDSVITMNLKR